MESIVAHLLEPLWAGAGAGRNRAGVPATEGFWIHLDVDVVDSSEMPAVDCPDPDGLSFSDLSDLLRRLASSSECVGMEVTIFDPDLDSSGQLAQRLVATLGKALT
jgi:arginase